MKPALFFLSQLYIYSCDNFFGYIKANLHRHIQNSICDDFRAFWLDLNRIYMSTLNFFANNDCSPHIITPDVLQCVMSGTVYCTMVPKDGPCFVVPSDIVPFS